jgi:SAM-dependent methyltransferase
MLADMPYVHFGQKHKEDGSYQVASSFIVEGGLQGFADDNIFLSLRNSFVEFGFNESNVRDRYVFEGAPGESFVFPKFTERRTTAITGLDALIHLFMGQESLPVECAARSLGFQCFSALQELELVRIEGDGTSCLATVRIEPVNDILICTDLLPTKPPVRPDYVMRPWDLSAQLYARIIPPTRCGSFLEMCCGSAYASLTAARNFAQFAYGVDINRRAVRFAEFNKKLNGIENVATFCGDLFEPIQSRVFDRIVAHPPYIPALVDSLTYKDGGLDGEHVSKRLIQEMPHHLSDGGEFYSYLSLSDRIDAPAELRVREFLGAAGQELDVTLLVVHEHSLLSFLFRRAGPNAFSAENEQLKETCRSLGITKFISTVLAIRPRRRSSPSTIRHRATGWQTVTAISELDSYR